MKQLYQTQLHLYLNLLYQSILTYFTSVFRNAINKLLFSQLDRDFNFDKNPHLRKVDLPAPVPGGTYDTYENKTAVTPGFCTVDTDVNMHDNFEFKTSTIMYPDKMQVAQVDILPQEECRRAWKQEMEIQPYQMCGRVQGQSFRGVCKVHFAFVSYTYLTSGRCHTT